MIYNIIIEPLEERYSIQWANWWNTAFNKAGVPSCNITGEILTTKIETGSFLDTHGTIYYKSSQLMTLAKMFKNNVIKNGDVLFFHDLWFPGLEALGYIRDITKVDFKIAGYFHAGAYDPADLLHKVNMQRWVTGCEQSWVKLVDHIFVGSSYHKTLLERLTNEPSLDKIKDIGYPVCKDSISKNVTDMKKENIVVFPHRLDQEKNPEIFDRLKFELLAENIPCEFIKTKEVISNKIDYYNLLKKAKVAVSTASQETFGIAMVESALLGCVPIAPNRLSYTDTIEADWRYNSYSELKALVKKALTIKNYKYFKENEYSVLNITNEVLKTFNIAG